MVKSDSDFLGDNLSICKNYFFSLFNEVQNGNHCLNESEAKKWARHDQWSNVEACLLLCGFDPQKIGPQELIYEDLLEALEALELDPLISINRLHELYDASKHNRQFSVSRRPIEFIIWANRLGLEIPRELNDYVEQFTIQFPKWGVPNKHRDKSQPDQTCLETWIYDSKFRFVPETPSSVTQPKNDNASVDKRKITTLQKMVVGVAAKNYGYDPRKLRNPTGQIKTDLELQGIRMDQATIKNTLDEAFQDIDYDNSVQYKVG